VLLLEGKYQELLRVGDFGTQAKKELLREQFKKELHIQQEQKE